MATFIRPLSTADFQPETVVEVYGPKSGLYTVDYRETVAGLVIRQARLRIRAASPVCAAIGARGIYGASEKLPCAGWFEWRHLGKGRARQ